MKKYILLSFLALSGCTSESRQEKIDALAYENSNNKEVQKKYPMLIDSGTKIVYQFGRMTADKGLKLYLDTIPYTPEAWRQKIEQLPDK
jgi:hypothetical protein